MFLYSFKKSCDPFFRQARCQNGRRSFQNGRHRNYQSEHPKGWLVVVLLVSYAKVTLYSETVLSPTGKIRRPHLCLASPCARIWNADGVVFIHGWKVNHAVYIIKSTYKWLKDRCSFRCSTLSTQNPQSSTSFLYSVWY